MRRTLSKREVKDFNDLLKSTFSLDEFVGKKDRLEVVADNIALYLVNGKPCFFEKDSILCPSLKLLLEKQVLKVVTVDMGAVKFVVSGADIMRPGIVDFDKTIKESDLVSIVDVIHKKPLAVGLSLLSADALTTSTSGKVIKNLHWVGDSIWKIEY